MEFRKLSANLILSSHIGFIKNGVLILDNQQRIVDLIDTGGNLKEEANLEYYNGILTPYFVNSLSGKMSIEDMAIKLNEILLFQLNNPETPLENLLKQTTIDAAKMLGLDNKMGGFIKGSFPGVILIENANLADLKITPGSSIRIIVAAQ